MKELITAKTRRVLNTLAITSLVVGGFLVPTVAHADPATNYADALVAPIDASYQGAVFILPQGGVVLRVGNQTPLSYVEFNANLPSPKLFFTVILPRTFRNQVEVQADSWSCSTGKI